MKLKVAVLFVALGGALAFGLIRSSSKARLSQQKEPKENRLHWNIQQAKNEGRKEVSIEAPTTDYSGSEDTDLEQILSTYTVVVAQPIEARTYEQDSNHLITWTKFRIVDSLSDLRPPICPGCDSLTAPADLLPIDSHEFLVANVGGTVVREGIKLREVDRNYPSFNLNENYLMFISLYPSRIAVTLGGPAGVFLIDSNENLAPLNKEPHALKQALKRQFKGSLRDVRNYLR